MRKELAWLLVAVLPLAASCVATSEAKPHPRHQKATTSLGIDETAIDQTVSPCDDFYHYACNNWIKRTPIPADRAAWYRSFSEIEQRNEEELKTILENLAAGKDQGDAYAKKLGDFYGACMDEAKVDKTADADLKSLLAAIDKVNTLDALAKQVAEMQLGLGSPLFAFGSQQDFKDATQMIGVADQGGLGLPDRDYYLKTDAKTKELQQKYLAHVQKMLELTGEPAAQAQKDSQTVWKVEHLLAQASMSRTERRQPKNIYHRLELVGLEREAPRFPWKAFLADIGQPNVTKINVAVPGFFAALNKDLETVPMSEWRVYLRWNLVNGAAPALSKKFVDENFNFYSKTLQGVDKIRPRWKRCVAATDRALGEALAQPFVRETFGADGKKQSEELVHDIEGAMQKNLAALSWMDAPTRKNAFEKLHAIDNKIGYPDKWRNYDKLEVSRASYLMNVLHANEFESHRQLDKIGKPVDRNEWEMTPPTVNAYYDPSLNEMVFPAGILQAPFFSRQAVPSVNFGAIGMVMGHELTHGFDDEGRQFDAKGNLVDWWTPAVSKEFDKRASCVAQQFDGYTVLGNIHLNGKLTLGENIADLGGIKLAFAAYHAAHPKAEKHGKWTADQLFFLGYAQAWCGSRKPELARMRVLTDPHSPPEYRVNGPLSNLHEFAEAFQCKPDSKMVRKDQCAIW